MSKLRPCPCCGSEEVHSIKHRKVNGTIKDYYVMCYSCGLSGPRKRKKTIATAAWHDLPRREEWVSVEAPPNIMERVFVEGTFDGATEVMEGYYAVSDESHSGWRTMEGDEIENPIQWTKFIYPQPPEAK